MTSTDTVTVGHLTAASGLWTVEIDSENQSTEELIVLPSREALCLALAIESWCTKITSSAEDAIDSWCLGSRTATREQDDGDSSPLVRDVAFCSSLAVLLCFIPEQHGRVVLSSGHGVDLIIPRTISETADYADEDEDDGGLRDQ